MASLQTIVVLICALYVTSLDSKSQHRLQHTCNAGEPLPILSLTVVEGTSSTIPCPNGFTKVSQDLNEGAGGNYEYLCFSTGDSGYGNPLTDLSVITSTNFHADCPTGYSRVRQDLNHQSAGLYVFFCYARGGHEAITDIYFLDSSSQQCKDGYTHLNTNLNSGNSGKVITTCVQKACHVTLYPADEALAFTTSLVGDETFKILQITDTHFGETTSGDIDTQFNVQWPVLLAEDPNLVIITGDAVSGYAWDGKDGWFADVYAGVVEPMIGLGYRWAYANGNHDPQADLSKEQIVDLDIQLGVLGGGLSRTQQGPTNITGATNYLLHLLSSDYNTTAFNLWIFDSGQDDCEGHSGWGCVYPDQVQWYEDTAKALATVNQLPDSYAFFHIPLQEFMQPSYSNSQCKGMKDESISCSSYNTGLFQAAKAIGDIKGFYCGHDHDNDFMFSYEGIWLAYGRKTGYGGYGPPKNWLRGGRVLALTGQPGSIKMDTWIRQQDQSKYVESSCSTWKSQSICAGASGSTEQSQCTLFESHYRSVVAGGASAGELSVEELQETYESAIY